MIKSIGLPKWGLLSVVIAACHGFAIPAKAQMTFTVFVDPHPTVSGGTIGFAFAGNKFVGSSQGNGAGILYFTDLAGGNKQLFAPQVIIPGGNPFSEHSLASSLGLGGFPQRDVYVGAGDGVLHISNDGSRSDMLVSELGLPVQALLFDPIGTFGHELIASTTGGQIFRINRSGVATLLATVGQNVEGLDVVPIGAGFGPFDGYLITTSEGDGLLRAISSTGTVTILNQGNPIPDAESVHFVPLDLGASGSPMEGLYAANFPTNILKASASQFSSLKGDAIVRTEQLDQRISRVHWDGRDFVITVIGYAPAQGEDAFFLTPAMINPDSSTCPPPSDDDDHDRGRNRSHHSLPRTRISTRPTPEADREH